MHDMSTLFPFPFPPTFPCPRPTCPPPPPLPVPHFPASPKKYLRRQVENPVALLERRAQQRVDASRFLAGDRGANDPNKHRQARQGQECVVQPLQLPGGGAGGTQSERGGAEDQSGVGGKRGVQPFNPSEKKNTTRRYMIRSLGDASLSLLFWRPEASHPKTTTAKRAK